MESFKTTSTSVTVPLWAKRSLMSAAVRDQDKLTTYSFFTLSVGCVSSGVSSVAATSCKVEHNWKQSLPVLKEDLEEKKREVEAWSLMEIGAFAEKRWLLENRWGAKRMKADSKVAAIRNFGGTNSVDKEIKGVALQIFCFVFYFESKPFKFKVFFFLSFECAECFFFIFLQNVGQTKK